TNLASKKNANGYNITGYANPRINTLLNEMIASSDLDQIRSHSWQVQSILAHDLPSIPGYFFTGMDVLRDGLSSDQGQLDFRTWHWYWDLQSLRVAPRPAGSG